MQLVTVVGVNCHKSAFNPWRTRKVWDLRLACGHLEWRYMSKFPQPPKRAKCHICEAIGG